MRNIILTILLYSFWGFSIAVFSQEKRIRAVSVPAGSSIRSIKKPDSRVYKIATPPFHTDVKFDLFHNRYDESSKKVAEYNLGGLHYKKGASAVFELIVNKNENNVHIHFPGIYAARLDIGLSEGKFDHKELEMPDSVKIGEKIPVMLFYEMNGISNVENIISCYKSLPKKNIDSSSIINSHCLLYYICTEQ